MSFSTFLCIQPHILLSIITEHLKNTSAYFAGIRCEFCGYGFYSLDSTNPLGCLCAILSIITVMFCRNPLWVLWLWILQPGLHQSTGLPLCNLVHYNCYVLQASAVSSVAMDSTAWTPPIHWAARPVTATPSAPPACSATRRPASATARTTSSARSATSAWTSTTTSTRAACAAGAPRLGLSRTPCATRWPGSASARPTRRGWTATSARTGPTAWAARRSSAARSASVTRVERSATWLGATRSRAAVCARSGSAAAGATSASRTPGGWTWTTP